MTTSTLVPLADGLKSVLMNNCIDIKNPDSVKRALKKAKAPNGKLYIQGLTNSSDIRKLVELITCDSELR
jgi:hypothetical protein